MLAGNEIVHKDTTGTCTQGVFFVDNTANIVERLQSKELLEIVFAILLLFATIGSTYCVFEAHKWGGVQGIAFAESSRYRAESLRYDALANSQRMIDVQVFLAWVDAADHQDTTRMTFLQSRFRDEFKPAFTAWLQRPVNESAFIIPPGTPFELSQYQLESSHESMRLSEQASAAFESGREANQTGDGYVMITVLYAIVLFVAGFGTKWKSHTLQYLFLITGIAIAVVATILLLGMPRI
jgi:hypothetical protein